MNTTTKSKLNKYTKPIIIVLLILIGLAVYHFAKSKQVPPSYLTAEAVMGDIENTVMTSGKVKPIQSVDVGAQVSGRITKLYVKVGDQVKKGDLIAQISQVEQKNNVANAAASLAQAQASLAQAQGMLSSGQGNIASGQATLKARLSELQKANQTLERLENLVSINAISHQDYDDAKIAVEVAQANVEVARANLHNAKNDVANAYANIQSQQANIQKAQNELSSAQENLSYTTITAPMDGTIVYISQKEGTTVNANQSAPTIVTLADLSQVRIKAQISEADVIHVKEGMPATFNIIGDTQKRHHATLNGIEPAPETDSGDGAVYYVGYLDVDNAERQFRINMTAQVNIITDAVKNTLIIPSSALINHNGKYSVRVLGTDGMAKSVPVSVGLNNRISAQITSGLTQGDKVVIGETSESDNKNQQSTSKDHQNL